MTLSHAGHPRCLLVLLAALGLTGCQSLGGLSLPWSHKPQPGYAAAAKKQADPLPPFKPEQQADVQMAVARALENHGQLEAAVKIYLDVVKKDPKRADAFHRLAVLHDKKGDSADAEKYYRSALKKNPDDAELQCDYGYSCYLQQRWKDAEAALRHAVRLDSQLARAHNNLGIVLACTGREEEALKEFRAAGANEAAARSNLAYGLALAGRPQDAHREYQRALSFDPSCPTARQGLAALDSVHAKQAASPEGRRS